MFFSCFFSLVLLLDRGGKVGVVQILSMPADIYFLANVHEEIFDFECLLPNYESSWPL